MQALKNHKHGWVFNEPVDPIKLGIPDYFQIVKHPMDLGTVKVDRECLSCAPCARPRFVRAPAPLATARPGVPQGYELDAAAGARQGVHGPVP